MTKACIILILELFKFNKFYLNVFGYNNDDNNYCNIVSINIKCCILKILIRFI